MLPSQPNSPTTAMRHRIATFLLHASVGDEAVFPGKTMRSAQNRESFHAEPCAVEALVCIVEIVRVLETGELPETWICDGFREHVGGLLDVPGP